MDSKRSGSSAAAAAAAKGKGKGKAAAEKTRKDGKSSRVYGFFALLSLILVFLSSGSGIALSVLIVVLPLPTSTEQIDFASRIVLFATSCVALLYVIFHIISARMRYVKRQGKTKPTRTAGRYVAVFTVQVARLAVAGWIGSVVLMILIEMRTGVDLSRGISGNVPGLELLVSGAGL
jgi:hypothetical protein